jgi:lysophospholipase L1-like esterase
VAEVSDMTGRRYVAIGDSFTEGLGDPGVDGRDRGWADRVAERLAVHYPGCTYANLAVRGRTVPEIVAEQVPAAVALGPDLVSFAGGINDALRRDWDLVTMAQNLQTGMADLAATGAQLVIVTYGRPSRRSRLMAVVEGRLREYREVTYDVAAQHRATVVDFWDATVFDDPRFWSDDRLHLNSLGHERVSMAVLDALGMPVTEWQQPLPTIAAQAPWARVSDDVTWFGRHFAPWIVRKARGRRSGDGITAKRPQCLPVSEAS